MKDAVTILFWTTLFAYVAAFVLHIIGFILRRERLQSAGMLLLWAALALHTILAVVHWLASGHAPVTDTFELNLTGTWFTILLFLFFHSLGKAPGSISLVVTPLTFILLGYGYIQGIEIKPMGPAFQSPWLVVHVIFAWLAFGPYSIATGAAIFFLLKSRNPRSERLARIPEPSLLDRMNYRFIVLGFINHAIMIVSGSIWAKKLWGHYWLWDPLETWSLISFLFYAFHLHTRAFWKWENERAAWLSVAGLVILIISFWGVDLFGPTMHPGP